MCSETLLMKLSTITAFLLWILPLFHLRFVLCLQRSKLYNRLVCFASLIFFFLFQISEYQVPCHEVTEERLIEVGLAVFDSSMQVSIQ